MPRPSEALIQCPFCKKDGVKAFHMPSYITYKKEHISSGSKTKWFREQEKWEIISDCPSCGKTKKEIQNNLEGKSGMTHEERLKKLQERGLPTRVEF